MVYNVNIIYNALKLDYCQLGIYFIYMAHILYAAISRDGFIAGSDDETPWSNEEQVAFQAFLLTCDVVLLGRRTFEIMQSGDGLASNGLIAGPRYIVVTENENLDTGKLEKIAIDSPSDMPTAERLGIIGGGELNGRLMQLGVIDEIILDIEQLDLGEGVKLLGSYDIPLKLELLGSDLIGETTVQRHYKVVK